MNKVRVEVFYQDNALQSIRIDHYEMEGLVAIENKTIPEWFMPASGRASWKGLKEELESQSRSEGEFCFIFNGPKEEQAVFQKCIQENGLGRMADELEIEEAAWEYLEIAQHCCQHGDDEGTLRAYEIAAKWYHMAVAEFVLGDYCERVLGDNKNAGQWFRKAAKQGYIDAEYRYGKCLENGTAVPESEADTAVSWYQKAAAQGQKDAAQELELRRQAQIEAERRRQAEEAERLRQADEEAKLKKTTKTEVVTRAKAQTSETVGTSFKVKHVSLKEAAETGRDKKYKDKTFVEKAALWNEAAGAVAKTVDNNVNLMNRNTALKMRAAAGVVQLAAALASETSQAIDDYFMENVDILD